MLQSVRAQEGDTQSPEEHGAQSLEPGQPLRKTGNPERDQTCSQQASIAGGATDSPCLPLNAACGPSSAAKPVVTLQELAGES